MKILITTLLSLAMMLEGWAFLSKPKIVIEKNEVMQAASFKLQASGLKLQASSSKLQTKEQEAANFDTMEEEDLQLELLGTALSNIKDPIAFIKDLRLGKQGAYRLGSIIRKAKVIKITMGAVVLDVNGKSQILSLSRRGITWAKIDGVTPAIISVSQDKIVVSKKGLISEANNILNNLPKLKIRPYYEANKISGMMVEGIADDSIIAAAGIRNKDIVKTVNNQKIDSYQKALQVFTKAKNQSEISVSLLRGGLIQNLRYHITN